MSSPRFGPFTLEKRLAVGGTSEVYLAKADEHPEWPYPLILKRPLPQFEKDLAFKAMFAREGRLQALITHPNVVRVYEAGTVASGEPYLATEFVEGVDGERLSRRVRQAGERIEAALATHIVREILNALEAVHSARDETGRLLSMTHRDVTPSNVYLSTSGVVKLGDFGLAHGQTRSMQAESGGKGLKGKFAYLAPEQVAGDPLDHRADLFSAAVILAELLLGRPLFSEGGQLAVLLAIRDGRIDAVNELRDRVPEGLFDALVKGLSRNPAARHQTAAEFGLALEPFSVPRARAASALATRVKWVLQNPTGRAIPALRRVSANAMPKAVVEEVELSPKDARDDREDILEAPTGRYETFPSYVHLASGAKLGPYSFAEIVHAITTGEVMRGDRVDYMGRGYKPIEEIDELQRFLPPPTSRTGDVHGPGKPDYKDVLTAESVLRVLGRIVIKRETGALFVEQTHPGTQKPLHKELYFVHGKLHHVASTDATELLGEYLVRRDQLTREELDLALAVLPRYEGRIGDTLISLGLVTPINVFRAIREQGRDRCADLFRWRGGKLAYYIGQTNPHVEFPLKLDLPDVMLTGLEAVRADEGPTANYRDRLGERVIPTGKELAYVEWPESVEYARSLVTSPTPLRDVLATATKAGKSTTGDVLRGLEILVACGVLKWEYNTLPLPGPA
ncbi:MAG: serine/threonine-protein kinase [Polyangiaceae bacterium]